MTFVAIRQKLRRFAGLSLVVGQTNLPLAGCSGPTPTPLPKASDAATAGGVQNGSDCGKLVGKGAALDGSKSTCNAATGKNPKGNAGVLGASRNAAGTGGGIAGVPDPTTLSGSVLSQPLAPGSTTGATGPTAVVATVTYTNTISAYLSAACTNCHNGGFFKPGPNLSNYEAAKAGAVRSLETMKAGTMPTSSRASAAEINAFDLWVKAGTPN